MYAQSLKAQLTKKKWSSAFLLMLVNRTGCGSREFWGKMSDGTKLSLKSPGPGGQLLYKAWWVYKKLHKTPWYGLKITIYPGGQHEIEYRSKAKCDNEFMER
jgi:hypothetical protein